MILRGGIASRISGHFVKILTLAFLLPCSSFSNRRRSKSISSSRPFSNANTAFTSSLWLLVRYTCNIHTNAALRSDLSRNNTAGHNRRVYMALERKGTWYIDSLSIGSSVQSQKGKATTSTRPMMTSPLQQWYTNAVILKASSRSRPGSTQACGSNRTRPLSHQIQAYAGRQTLLLRRVCHC